MRDLKPAKVKITPDGQVKLRDLGLAKGTGDDGPTGDGYMAPEQVRAERRSTRGPISRPMALVFNELLTGQRAFMGETVSDILAPPQGQTAFESAAREYASPSENGYWNSACSVTGREVCARTSRLSCVASCEVGTG